MPTYKRTTTNTKRNWERRGTGPELREVIPFYMKHSYHDFRHHSENESRQPTGGAAKLGKQHTANDFRTFSSHLSPAIRGGEGKVDGVNHTRRSSSLVDSIQRWNMKSDALCEAPKLIPARVDEVLTPVEENGGDGGSGGAGTLQNSSLAPSTPHFDAKRGSLARLSIYASSLNGTPSTYDRNKTKRLRSLLQKRLQEGSDVKELARASDFDDVLEICDQNHFFPAYERGTDMSFDDWRALRKCKYLRVSEKTITGLKEATLRRLSNNEE